MGLLALFLLLIRILHGHEQRCIIQDILFYSNVYGGTGQALVPGYCVSAPAA